ncbi:hypothetical protein, partial [Paenibacillus elgii]|uniref:hypothetical protein n=1 Tax=Paenibacillus elgii TaxID=189691 RepID=UPI00203E4C4C
DKEDRDEIIKAIVQHYNFHLSKLKVNEKTMYNILKKISQVKQECNAISLMNVLYQTQKETFLRAFKKSTLL